MPVAAVTPFVLEQTSVPSGTPLLRQIPHIMCTSTATLLSMVDPTRAYHAVRDQATPRDRQRRRRSTYVLVLCHDDIGLTQRRKESHAKTPRRKKSHAKTRRRKETQKSEKDEEAKTQRKMSYENTQRDNKEVKGKGANTRPTDMSLLCGHLNTQR
jgi:hypothetical protein